MKHMRNEEAVSPVIGVILMVVITVIIAAVLAVFAFGVGAPTKGPTASLKITSMENATDTIWIQHYGGDSLRVQDMKIVVETLNSDGVVLTGSTVVSQVGAPGGGQFAAGDTLSIDLDGATVEINGVASAGAVVAPAAADITTASSVRATIIDVPTGSVLSKPQAKIT